MLPSDPPARLCLCALGLMTSRRLHVWVVRSEEADRISLIAASQERVVDQVPSLFLGSNRPPLDLLSGPPKMLIFLSASQSIITDQRDVDGPKWRFPPCIETETDKDEATHFWPQIRPTVEEAMHSSTMLRCIRTTCMDHGAQEHKGLANIHLRGNSFFRLR